MIRAQGALAFVAAAVAFASPAAAQSGPPLAYQIEEGRNLNAFLRDGPVAAHLLLRSGRDPRLLVAFPAGNSGVGLWFAPLDTPAIWRLDRSPTAVEDRDAKGRVLRGVRWEASIPTRALDLRAAVLSNVRVLRDFEFSGSQPAEVTAAPVAGEQSIRWERDRLDGAPGYRLLLEVTGGELQGQRIVAGPDGRIALRLTALTGELPLQGLSGDALLKHPASADPDQLHALEFLSYREKFLAGSWRFNTYFGRDTLISLRLLMPALRPQAIEAGFASVLDRLSPEGDVAHEEDIGEFAVLDHLRREGQRSAAPVYDYRMVDETLLLAPIAADWLLGKDSAGDDRRAQARALLAANTDTAPGRTRGAALVANLLNVVRQGEAFAVAPRRDRLVALKSGMKAGNWRDSDDGLGGGSYAYDVNAVLMPAALDAAARLAGSGLLDPWLDRERRIRLGRAAKMALIWRREAPRLFEMSVAASAARDAVMAEARAAGLDPAPALAALPEHPLTFHAISLDAKGRPVPVLHSDEGFALLLGEPPEPELRAMVAAMMRPFPAGLFSDAGLMVANPAFAPAELRQRFSRNAYHGEVVWSWQHALVIAGLQRQLARKDISGSTREQLLEAQHALRDVVARTRSWRNSELWSWKVGNGKIVPSAFGAAAGDADESNAAQLWSTVFLADEPGM